MNLRCIRSDEIILASHGQVIFKCKTVTRTTAGLCNRCLGCNVFPSRIYTALSSNAYITIMQSNGSSTYDIYNTLKCGTAVSKVKYTCTYIHHLYSRIFIKRVRISLSIIQKWMSEYMWQIISKSPVIYCCNVVISCLKIQNLFIFCLEEIYCVIYKS